MQCFHQRAAAKASWTRGLASNLTVLSRAELPSGTASPTAAVAGLARQRCGAGAPCGGRSPAVPRLQHVPGMLILMHGVYPGPGWHVPPVPPDAPCIDAAAWAQLTGSRLLPSRRSSPRSCSPKPADVPVGVPVCRERFCPIAQGAERSPGAREVAVACLSWLLSSGWLGTSVASGLSGETGAAGRCGAAPLRRLCRCPSIRIRQPRPGPRLAAPPALAAPGPVGQHACAWVRLGHLSRCRARARLHASSQGLSQ